MSFTAQILVFTLCRKSINELIKNDPLRMAGATAFFTTFALPPILLIIIHVLGLIINRQVINENLFSRLSDEFGEQAAIQLVNILQSVQHLEMNGWIITVGILYLLFVATSVFKIIKDSFNQIWKIHVAVKRSVWFGFGNRLRSIVVILLAGIFFLLGVFAESMQVLMGRQVHELFPNLGYSINIILVNITSIIIATAWFIILFRFLPDGKASWSSLVTGSLVTSILFNLGKLLVRNLLMSSNINTIYGTSGSIVLLLLFVFYSAIILYFGASFIKVYAEYRKDPITTLRHASHYKLQELKE